jgi:DNA processing protein
LIAAASQATIVIEAGWRSGSLNTAGHASALGRPLGAVPGPVESPTSAGCHRLIRDFQATLVTNPDEMAELAGGPISLLAPSTGPASTPRSSDSSEVTRLLDAMSYTAPRLTPDIAARAGLSLGTVQSLLGTLELDARVTERERGWVRTKQL